MSIHTKFYDDGQGMQTYRTDWERNLFVPKDRLVFVDGSKAEDRDWDFIDSGVVDERSTPYLEIFPVDTTGGNYLESITPWIMTPNSYCDD